MSARLSRTAFKVRAQAVASPEIVSKELATKCINAIRFLAIDGVNKAKSGHPGLPMGCAPMSYILFKETMNFNPKNSQFFNRDRFVLSAGHGSMLQYAMMHLSGYDSVKVKLHGAHAECPYASVVLWNVSVPATVAVCTDCAVSAAQWGINRLSHCESVIYCTLQYLTWRL